MRRIICIILWHLGFSQVAYDISPSIATHLMYKDVQKIQARSREAWKLKEMQWRIGR